MKLFLCFRADTEIGRIGLCLFTIGIYSIYKGISLLLPDLSESDRKAIEKEKGRMAWIKIDKENEKKKSLLYYKTLVGLCFGIVFSQFSKSPTYALMKGFGILLYNQIYSRILASAKQGFNDDLMVLPLTGTFSVNKLLEKKKSLS